MLNLNQKDLQTIKNILKNCCPTAKVWAFGSRIKGTAQLYSDLDLVIINPQKLLRQQKTALKFAFEDSDLPFRVDILDWHTITADFRKIIENNYEVVM